MPIPDNKHLTQPRFEPSTMSFEPQPDRMSHRGRQLENRMSRKTKFNLDYPPPWDKQ